MKKQSVSEWRQDAEKLFGKDYNNWKFRCPACGKVFSIKDLIDVGGNLNDAYQTCIGRYTGKGAPAKDSKDGCNWAAFGFLGTLGKGRIVINDNNEEVEVFDFAEEGSDGKENK